MVEEICRLYRILNIIVVDISRIIFYLYVKFKFVFRNINNFLGKGFPTEDFMKFMKAEFNYELPDLQWKTSHFTQHVFEMRLNKDTNLTDHKVDI